MVTKMIFLQKIVDKINEKESKNYKFYKHINEKVSQNIFSIYDKNTN